MEVENENTDETNELLAKHWDNLVKIKEKSEDDFDKNITAIAAGTFAITLTFHQVIVKATETKYHILLYASWLLLAILMVFNLVSNFISILHTQSSLQELSNDGSLDENKNNFKITLMNRINFVKIVFLIFGLASFLAYVIINMNNKDDQNEEEGKSSIGSRSVIPVPAKLRSKAKNVDSKPSDTNSSSSSPKPSTSK